MPKKSRKTKAERDSIRAHVAAVAGLDDGERAALAALLLDPGPVVELPEFGEPDAAARFASDPPGFPEPDTRWFAALMQKTQGILPNASDTNGPAIKLTADQRLDLLMRHAYARFMLHTLLNRCSMRPADADTCRAVLRWHARALALMHRAAGFEAMLIVWCAGRYKRSPLDLAERISVCSVALLRAIERYDPRRGKFSTCATKYMRMAMATAIKKHKRLAAGTVSETDCGGREEDAGLLASAASGDAPRDELHLDLAGFLAEPGLLTLTERRVLAGRFGVAMGSDFDPPNGESLTLEAVGELLGLTRERVRQVETVALEKLRCRFAGRPIPDNGKTLLATARRRKRGQLDGPDPLQEIAPVGRERSTIRRLSSTM